MGDLFGFKMVMILPIFQILGIVLCNMEWFIRRVDRGKTVPCGRVIAFIALQQAERCSKLSLGRSGPTCAVISLTNRTVK